MKKHGYTKLDNEKKVKDAYLSGAKTAYKISKITGLHYKTAVDIMFRLGLVDQSRAHNTYNGIYVHQNHRGQKILVFKSIYEAVKYFRENIDGFLSVSHATKLFRQSIEQYKNEPIEVYKNDNTGERIMYYSEALDEDFKNAVDNELDYIP